MPMLTGAKWWEAIGVLIAICRPHDNSQKVCFFCGTSGTP